MAEFKGLDNRTYNVAARLGGGGQGNVYRVCSSHDEQEYAVKWYHSGVGTPEQRHRLEALIKAGAPVSGVPGVAFIWPLEVIQHAQHTGFGYVMPLIDTERFVSLNHIINGRCQQPTWSELCHISYLLCMALESVHRNGLAYCDINLGNIMFDTGRTELVICDNDNVAVNNDAVAICGVPEFMAPEVALGQTRPNAQSDLYSIAILLYQLWMWEHPMDGRLTLTQVNCWDIPARKKRFAAEPLFVHHPVDDRNSAASVDMLKLSLKRWQTCPPVLQQAFTTVFTAGVHNPENRLRLSDWQRLFLELEASAVICPQCRATNLIDISATSRDCFHCQRPLPVFLMLKIQHAAGASHLVVSTGAELRRHHLEINPPVAKARKALGVIEAHPQKANVHGLRNQTSETWYYDQNNQKLTIAAGKARPLLPEGRLSIGSSRIEIVRLPGGVNV